MAAFSDTRPSRRTFLKRTASTAIALGLGERFLASPAWAAAFPGDQPIEIVIPFAPGGGADIQVRILSKSWEPLLGQKLVAKFAPGGRTIIGMTRVHTASPDGHTLGQNLVGTFANVLAFEKVPFTASDFAWIGTYSVDVEGLFVKKDAPWRDIAQFVDDMKSRPAARPMRISVAGPLSVADVVAKVFVKVVGGNAVVVPFEGGGPARSAVVGGKVEAAVSDVGPAIALEKEFRGLGVFADENPVPGVYDMPQVAKALKVELPPLPDASAGIYTRALVRDRSPEAFGLLKTTFERAMADENYRKEVAGRVGPYFTKYRGPEATQQLMAQFIDTAKKFQDLFK
jgi:tripartite-type tricarboxylate transporter receptor subunit TctC